MALTKEVEYRIAAAVLILCILVATFFLWVISLFKCRRRGDPARWGFTWMKFCGPLFCAYVNRKRHDKVNIYPTAMVLTCSLLGASSVSA